MNDHLPLGDPTPCDVKTCSDAASAAMTSGPGATLDPEPGDISSTACDTSHSIAECPERTVEPGAQALRLSDDMPGDGSGCKSPDLCDQTVTSDAGSKPDRNPRTALFLSIARREVCGIPRVRNARRHLPDRRGYRWRKPLGRRGTIAEPST